MLGRADNNVKSFYCVIIFYGYDNKWSNFILTFLLILSPPLSILDSVVGSILRILASSF